MSCTFKNGTHLAYGPDRAPTGELADTEFHVEQRYPANDQNDEIRNEKDSCKQKEKSCILHCLLRIIGEA